mmetsp:Transcript_27684/g.41001  ORF Transcript_27684/g.41001 Transcript_27684/m.41001 type:complete len:328 (+) Transcript_27684:39-1022(+)
MLMLRYQCTLILDYYIECCVPRPQYQLWTSRSAQVGNAFYQMLPPNAPNPVAKVLIREYLLEIWEIIKVWHIIKIFIVIISVKSAHAPTHTGHSSHTRHTGHSHTGHTGHSTSLELGHDLLQNRSHFRIGHEPHQFRRIWRTTTTHHGCQGSHNLGILETCCNFRIIEDPRHISHSGHAAAHAWHSPHTRHAAHTRFCCSCLCFFRFCCSCLCFFRFCCFLCFSHLFCSLLLALFLLQFNLDMISPNLLHFISDKLQILRCTIIIINLLTSCQILTTHFKFPQLFKSSTPYPQRLGRIRIFQQGLIAIRDSILVSLETKEDIGTVGE